MLLHKLNNFGISGKLHKWIAAFLSGRSQIVKLNGSFSHSVAVTSGVPQGSVLGPALFMMFINDLPSVLHLCKFRLFADDGKIWHKSVTKSDADILQLCLNSLYNWSILWQLPIAIEKTVVMHVGVNNPHFIYTLNGVVLAVVESICDLGVHYDNKLKFNLHCVHVANKAYLRAKLIMRCFLSVNVHVLMRAYYVYIRPILDYNSHVWNPFTLGNMRLIENVQRYFTRIAFYKCGLPRLPYNARLQYLNCETLQVRRVKRDLVETYKYVMHFYDSEISNILVIKGNSHTRGHDFKLVRNYSRTDNRKYFLCNRVFNVWNALDATMFKTNVIKAFHNRISVVDLSKFVVAL